MTGLLKIYREMLNQKVVYILMCFFYFNVSVQCLAAGPQIDKKSGFDVLYREGLIDDVDDEMKVAMAEEREGRTHEQIMGSSSIDTIKSNNSNVYFLYGAEHLNLKNYYFDIPVSYNEAVKKWMKFFLNKGKEYFVRYSERAGRYAPILGKILEDYGLPRDLIFLAMAESGFQNKAKSWARAVGPWQFMPYTGKKYGLKINWYVDERRDPIKATIAAAKYLKKLYGDFESWELAAAAYNAGEGKVSRAIKKYQTENFWKMREGRYLKSETKNYVPKIMALAIIGKNLESFGLRDIDFQEPLDFDEVDVKGNTDLIALSEFVGIPLEEIQRLNPEILRWNTPPDVEVYKLRMPVGFKQIWDSCCMNKDFLAKDFQTYTLKSATYLKYVAKLYRVDVDVLAQLNGLSPHQKVKRGTELKLPFRVGQNHKDEMYADLYELPRRSVVRRRNFNALLSRAQRQGRKIVAPKEYYLVKKGDNLWNVSRKTGVDIETIIRSNLSLLKQGRMLMPGDRLVIR